KNRCLILADGFYEWKLEGKTKTPYFIRLKSGEPFSFAGLWANWHAPDGSEIRSCTIITTSPNKLLASIHNRMPVIVPEKARDEWTDPANQDSQKLISLLGPYPENEMEAFPVSTLVNSPSNDNPDCLQPAV